MKCWIYKGHKKANTYLYVTEKDNFSAVPESLLQLLGELKLVIHVDLAEKKKLALADIDQVRGKLQTDNYFLQMPPGDLKVEKLC